MRVAILDDIHEAYEGTEGVRRLRACAKVRIFTGPFGDPDALAGFDAVVANRERTHFTKALLEALPDLRIIAQTGNHVYHIEMATAATRGVLVAKATGGYSVGAAELAIGLMIALMRRIPDSDRALKSGTWQPPMTRVLRGKTLGIVGLGHVGRHVAGIARAFGMNVIAWGRRLDAATAAAHGVARSELDDLLAGADVVSIHATLSEETRGLIDARRLALMKPHAILINTARGRIVDEAALAAALAAGRIAGAGLDVFGEEPLPAASPFTGLSNVILTPHIGWPTDMAYADFANAAADTLVAYREGRPVACFEERH
ncbi:MAG: D-2-hydroxyacid dehydrogenase family protein [Alphaproteobacteria bacterium]|nr:D-2-hydroxyacid dehydrogenase family protein [Alphaproteobacteria bacterium]